MDLVSGRTVRYVDGAPADVLPRIEAEIARVETRLRQLLADGVDAIPVESDRAAARKRSAAVRNPTPAPWPIDRSDG